MVMMHRHPCTIPMMLWEGVARCSFSSFLGRGLRRGMIHCNSALWLSPVQGWCKSGIKFVILVWGQNNVKCCIIFKTKLI